MIGEISGLAGVLRKTPEVCTKFVEWLIRHDGSEVEINEARIHTQEKVRGVCPDIYVDARSAEGQRHVLWVENKIGAKQGGRQIERYLDSLGSENHAATRTLVYITLKPEQDLYESKPDNVNFKHLKWFHVYDWLKESAKSEHTFLRELLELMEEWSMTSNLELSATDLAATTKYKKSAEQQFRNVLEMVREKCVIKNPTGNWTSYALAYGTSRIADSGIYLYFGFDFDREDNEWSVEKLCIPSAFVMVCSRGDKPACLKNLSDCWTDVPQYMYWDESLRVRQMSKKLLVSQDSFGEAYLDFFNTAIQDFKDVSPKGWFINSS